MSVLWDFSEVKINSLKSGRFDQFHWPPKMPKWRIVILQNKQNTDPRHIDILDHQA